MKYSRANTKKPAPCGLYCLVMLSTGANVFARYAIAVTVEPPQPAMFEQIARFFARADIAAPFTAAAAVFLRT